MAKRRHRWRWALLIVVVLLVAGGVVLHWPVPPPKLQIGPETTFLDGPVNPDGTVDYLAALNTRCAEGVTNENNAAVPLVKALGPLAIKPFETREVALRTFKLQSLPGKGAYFVRLEDWAAAQPATAPGRPPTSGPSPLRDRLDELTEAPWDPKANPVLARWLERNDAALDLVARAGGRSRYYVQRVPDDGPLGFLSLWQGIVGGVEVEAARALAARGMRKLHAGDVKGAWADTRAVCGLGRLKYQRRDLMACLIGIGMERVGTRGVVALARSGRLTGDQARAMLAEIDALPPRGDAVDAVNRSERFRLLEVMVAVSRGMPVECLADGRLRPRRRADLDPNVMLRVGNEWYDRQLAVIRTPLGPGHAAADEAYSEDFRKMVREVTAPGAKVRRVLLKAGGWPFRKARSRQEALRVVASMMSALGRIPAIQERVLAQADLARIAVALAGYRARTGRYPEAPGELCPGWLKKIPPDRFTGKDLLYKRTDEGYVLYSAGPDGVDDGGLERVKGAEKYDIVVRVPPVESEGGRADRR